jgi:hypothetical protein
VNAPSSVPATPPPPKVSRLLRWQRRILGFCFVVFTVEVGLFLIIFPWLDSWDLNWLSLHGAAEWHSVWMSRYLRGGVSGLGVLNLWIALNELARQVRSLVE